MKVLVAGEGLSLVFSWHGGELLFKMVPAEGWSACL
jgi:hypothetical protein